MPNFEVEKLDEIVIKAAQPEGQAYLITERFLRGFGVRIGAKSKTFFVRRRLHGTTHRISLGTFPQTLTESARKKAIAAWVQMEQQIHPSEAKKHRMEEAKARGEREQWTLATLWPLYLAESRDVPLASNTVKGYEAAKKRLAGSTLWKKPVVLIEGADLRAAYEFLLATANKRRATNGGKTTAAQIMRNVSVVLNYGLKERLGGGFKNPFESIPERQKWEQPKPRNRTLLERENSLELWWKAVEGLRAKADGRAKDGVAVADFLQLSVLFGSRKTELLALTWNDVDLEAKEIIFRTTKNKQAHQIPLAKKALEILTNAQKRRELLAEEERSIYVFPASREGWKSKVRTHIKEPKNSLSEVIDESGVQFSLHDLRRTFGSLLGEVGASFYQTKAALNHAAGGDVSQKHYIRIRLRALRDIFERVEQTILEEAKVV